MNTHPYPSDLSDEEWAILGPLVTPGKQAGHPQVLELRRIVDAVFYLLRAGCQWRALPHDFPPWAAVFYHYAKWRRQGTWERINAALREQHRRAKGRQAPPSAARRSPRSASWIRSRVPSLFQVRKYQYTAVQGGKSCGRARHWQPVRAR